MKNQRPGHLIDFNDCLHICATSNPNQIGNVASCFQEDIIITVNEILADGKVRLGVSTPSLMDTTFHNTLKQAVNTNSLLLQRQIGSSVIVRKQETVSQMDALRDLRSTGILIKNSTRPLSHVAEKTGAELLFFANQSIWKIIRLELTLLRRAK